VFIDVKRAPVGESVGAIGAFRDLDTGDASRLRLEWKKTSSIDLALRTTVRAARWRDLTTTRGSRGSARCRGHYNEEDIAEYG
jgi:hypothetical protein